MACRFGSSHIKNNRNVIDAEKYKLYESCGPYVRNQLKSEVQHSLRKKNYDFKLPEAVVKYNDNLKKESVGDKAWASCTFVFKMYCLILE